MEDLIFLAHRIPYPPNKGDKIRSYHLLKYLSLHFKVHLGSFIDDSADVPYIPVLQEICESTFFVKKIGFLAKLKALTGLFSHSPLSVEYFSSAKMHRWVQSTIAKKNIKKVFLFSSPMFQYLNQYQELNIVMDFIDIDSNKWKHYAFESSGIVKLIFEREHRLLSQYELTVASAVDASLFVSEVETMQFRAKSKLDNIFSLSNGVDSEFFDPHLNYQNPYPKEHKVIIFTGTMNYGINIEAVTWFSNHVMPKIVSSNKLAYFYIVGSKPTPKVKALERAGNIKVVGHVDDIRPYLKHAIISVAPMQVASGFKNKIIEAIAMNLPVLGTREAISDPAFLKGVNLQTADDPQQQADIILERLDAKEKLPNYRLYVKNNCAWEQVLEPFIKHFN